MSKAAAIGAGAPEPVVNIRANWFTPVIVMSALPHQVLQERARELGAVAFFRKPFDIDDFRTAVINASLTSIRARMRSAFDA